MAAALKCPEHLKGEARKEWARITGELKDRGLLDTSDRAAIVLYCEQFRLWSEAVAEVIAQGAVVKLPNGWPGPNPYVAIIKQTTAQMSRLLNDLLCTPRSREKAEADKVDEPDEPGELLF